MKSNPTVTQRKIAELTGETISTVKYYMKKLKEDKVIAREGTGHRGNKIKLFRTD